MTFPDARDPRVKDLLDTIVQLAQGSLDARAQVSARNDTVDTIANALNELAENLGIRHAECEKINRQLAENAAHLVQTEKLRSLGEAVADVAHELNQPLNTIKIITQSILRYLQTYGKEKLEAELYEILDLVGTMAEIIDHMRVFIRRADDLTPKMVDLNELLDGTLRLVGQQIRSHRIEVVADYDEKLPGVAGNPVRLEQALLNLINNARGSMDAVDRPNKTILLRTYTTTRGEGQPKGFVVVEVADNGKGIPQELAERIFEPFFTTKDPGKGTGLGLSITRKIVAEHNGFIEVESAEGQGALFRVVLPEHGSLVDNEDPHNHTEISAQQRMQGCQRPATVSDHRPRAKRALVVDDSLIGQQVIQGILAKLGCATSTANDGFEAMKLMETQEFDFVIADIEMPKLDGLELVHRLRSKEKWQTIPIVLVSAYDTQEHRRRAVDAGADAFLDKTEVSESMLKDALKIGGHR